ncbi:MAG TPA: hypothetical protein VF819_09535 [Nitrospira sp.]
MSSWFQFWSWAPGAACRKHPQYVLGSLRDRKTGDFIENITTRTVPLDDSGVDVDGLGKRLVALRVGGVDRLPRWQHEDGSVERVGGEHGLELAGRHGRGLVHHAERLDQPAIKEDPLGSGRSIEYFSMSRRKISRAKARASGRRLAPRATRSAMMARADSATVA